MLYSSEEKEIALMLEKAFYMVRAETPNNEITAQLVPEVFKVLVMNNSTLSYRENGR